jgi:Arc/MetJ-type ribon-helix-helix transcriptional regulator
MVRVLANIPAKTYDRIIELVKNGDYRDVSQFIQAACENQLAMSDGDFDLVEASGNPAAQRVQSTGEQRVPQVEGKRIAKPRKRATKRSRAAEPPQVSRRKGDTPPPEAVKAALSLFAMPDSVLPPMLSPMDEYIEQWPWGQTNRYLPMKLVVRAVASLAVSGSWPNLAELGEKLRLPAAAIGSALEAADTRAGRKREAALATALPRLAVDKSQRRFVSSFLCALSPTGIFYPGGTFFYGFTALLNGGVGLTESGLGFCRLHNPVLDDSPERSRSTLSEEEKEWLRAYVLEIPGESAAFRTVLGALGEDQLSPKDFAERVGAVVGDDPSSGGFKIKFHGVVSRMIELGLIKREWEGTRARYERNEGKPLIKRGR